MAPQRPLRGAGGGVLATLSAVASPQSFWKPARIFGPEDRHVWTTWDSLET
jgi:hypothetical protein